MGSKFSVEAVIEKENLPYPGIEVRYSDPRARRLDATPGHSVFLHNVQRRSQRLDSDSYQYLANGANSLTVQCEHQHVAMFQFCPKALCHQ